MVRTLDVQTLRMHFLLLAAAVMARNGRVKVPLADMAVLQTHTFKVEVAGPGLLKFTLTPPDGKVYDLAHYTDRNFYRRDLILKYLISISPKRALLIRQDQVDEAEELFLNVGAGKDGRVFASLSSSPLPQRPGSLDFEFFRARSGQHALLVSPSRPPNGHSK